jgi:hypothetical protein
MKDIDAIDSARAASLLTLLSSGGTLICCALPAAFVALGAGAALSTLIATVPQLVWFSEHKTGVFLTAGIMLLVSGLLQWRARKLPCPVDPDLARTCITLRRRSLQIYCISAALFSIGGFFAFVAPLLM